MKLAWLLGFLTVLAVGCSSPTRPAPTLTLATTTSTQDTGLLDTILPMFRAQTGIEVKAVAVGTGQALELGRRGDADILLVHAPPAEEKFMAEGHGSLREPLMFNEFVLVGPRNNPGGITAGMSVNQAFAAIASTGSLFVSRGDDSGTHQKEKAIWQQAGVEPKGGWYIQAGAGMGHVLRMANEKQAYTLTDRATFLVQRNTLQLLILSEGDQALRNPYSVIVVNAAKHPHVQAAAAQRFVDFLLSQQGQQIIADFGKEQYGQPLFFVYQRRADE